MNRVILLFVLIAVLFFASCKPEVETGTIIATVNGNNLTLEQLITSLGEDVWTEKTLEEKREIVNQWVDLTILYSYAASSEYFGEDIALGFMANNAQKKIFANALIAYELSNMRISNEDLYNYYRLREAEFTEQVREFRVQRIFFNSEDDMRNVKRMLDNREIQFTPAAQRYSEESIGRNGGFMANLVTKTSPDSLLWVELDKMDRFHEVVIPHGDGWIIARWHEFRMTTANRTFYSMRAEIEETMKQERRQELYERVLREARIASQVIILL